MILVGAEELAASIDSVEATGHQDTLILESAIASYRGAKPSRRTNDRSAFSMRRPEAG